MTKQQLLEYISEESLKKVSDAISARGFTSSLTLQGTSIRCASTDEYKLIKLKSWIKAV